MVETFITICAAGEGGGMEITMKPIIFARIADMKYYKGITDIDSPENGGSYVKDTGMAHECYNFDVVKDQEGNEFCLGFTMLMGSSKIKDSQLHIEKIVGCELYKKEEVVEGVTVVWVSKSQRSKTMRVVGFYKNATVFREYQSADFDNGYVQAYNFVADKKDCVLLPYSERHSNSVWYVPASQKNGASFGFGRSNIWYAGSNTRNEKEIQYVERMLDSIEHYQGENWIERGGVQ